MPKIELLNAIGGKIIDYTEEVMLEVNKRAIEALDETSDLLRDTMKSPGYVPKKSGNLAKSIKVRRYPKRLMNHVVIGNKKAWYGHIVIGGAIHTKTERFIKRNGKYVKQKIKPFTVPPNNFPLRAIDDKRNEFKIIWNKAK